MESKLETADHILKLVLATGVILCYLLGVIAGPFATALLVLALGVIVFFFAQLILTRYMRD